MDTNTMREDYMRNEDFFMSIALLSAKRSKDPGTRVGACIVNKDGNLVSVGHNHMPLDSDAFPWRRDSDNPRENKYMYVCHAALTTILKSSADVKGGTIYLTMFPNSESGKVIIQAGIKEIVYLIDKYNETQETQAARIMYEITGVTVRETNSLKDDHLERQDFFMAMALLSSQRSRDPLTQVGACFVNQHGILVGVGHNEVTEYSDLIPWAGDSAEMKRNKHQYVCQEGLTAILIKNLGNVQGCTMYVTVFPNSESAKIISQARIKEVIYLSKKYENCEDAHVVKRIFNTTGVVYRHFEPKNRGKIIIDFPDMISNII